MRWLGIIGVRLAAALTASFLCTTSMAASYPVSDQSVAAIRLLDRKDLAGALAAANAALKSDPHDPVALATRGNVYIALGEYEDAIIDHDAVLALVGDDVGALTNACWARALANKDLEQASRYCDRAVKGAWGYSQRLRVYDTRGFLDLRQGEFEAAMADYNKALDASPRTASALYGRGIAKTRLGRLSEGRVDIAAALKVQPDIDIVYKQRGLEPTFPPQ
jgi:tetratricopeptide (TPR) repeat protein